MVEGAGLEIRCSALHYRGFESLSLRYGYSGEVSEWSKVHDWKSCMVKSHRGFESPPLRFSSRYLAMYAAQPRQGRDAAAVSGMYMRPGPFAAVFHYLQISFALHDSHVQAMAFRFF